MNALFGFAFSEEQALVREEPVPMRVANCRPLLLHVRPVELHVLECFGGILPADVQEELLLLDRRAPDEGAERAGANGEEVLALEELFASDLF